MPKAETAFSRHAEIFDTTIGWRFVNPLMKAQYGVDSMPETGENVAEQFEIARADQDAFALRSPGARGGGAVESGRFAREITPVDDPAAQGRSGRGRERTSIPRADLARVAGASCRRRSARAAR